MSSAAKRLEKKGQGMSATESVILNGLSKMRTAGTEAEVRDILDEIQAGVGSPMGFIDKAGLLVQALAYVKFDQISDNYVTPAEAESDLIQLFLQVRGAERELV